jgi:hypothetical protein
MSDRKIREAVQQLAGTHLTDKVHIIPCVVDEVDLETRSCTCTPIGGKAATEITGVQLMAEVDDGLLLVPAIDSTVIVCYSDKNVPYIALYSELEKATLVTLNGIQFQGGELGGLVIISELLEKINNLESAFNLLNAKVNSLAPTPVIEPIIPTERSEIENTSVTHGE